MEFSQWCENGVIVAGCFLSINDLRLLDAVCWLGYQCGESGQAETCFIEFCGTSASLDDGIHNDMKWSQGSSTFSQFRLGKSLVIFRPVFDDCKSQRLSSHCFSSSSANSFAAALIEDIERTITDLRSSSSGILPSSAKTKATDARTTLWLSITVNLATSWEQSRSQLTKLQTRTRSSRA